MFKRALILCTALLASCAPTTQENLLYDGFTGNALPTRATPRDGSRTCQNISEADVAALFDRWNASLKTLDPAKVAANYRPDGLLLPTVSNRPRINAEQIQEYFVSFLKKHPEGKINQRVIRIGCNVAIDGGVYTFTFKDGHQVIGRYTYVYEYENGQWLIASHHSSAMPQDVKMEPWNQ